MECPNLRTRKGSLTDQAFTVLFLEGETCPFNEQITPKFLLLLLLEPQGWEKGERAS